MENHKILVTEEKRLAIKDIAERNGINIKNKELYSDKYCWLTINGLVGYYERFSDFKELTFEQFKEIFNKVEFEEKLKGYNQLEIVKIHILRIRSNYELWQKNEIKDGLFSFNLQNSLLEIEKVL